MPDLSHDTLHSTLIPTKVASEISGYNPDYLARLCSQGKISGTKVGRSWLVDRASLEAFVQAQLERKAERSEEIATEREKEYRNAQKSIQETTPVVPAIDLSHIKRIVGKSRRIFPNNKRVLLAPRTALAAALLVVASAAYASTSPALVSAVEHAGDTAQRVAMLVQPQLFAHSGSLRVTENETAPEKNPLQTLPAATTLSHAFAFVSGSHANAFDTSYTSLVKDSSAHDAQPINLASAIRSLPLTLAHAYVDTGIALYDSSNAFADIYLNAVQGTANTSLTIAATGRDGIVRAPEFANAILDSYANGINDWNDATPKVAGTLTLGIYDIGNTIGNVTTDAPHFALVAKDTLAYGAVDATQNISGGVRKNEYLDPRHPFAVHVADASGTSSDDISDMYWGALGTAAQYANNALGSVRAVQDKIISAPAQAEENALGLVGYTMTSLDGSSSTIATDTQNNQEATAISFLPVGWQELIGRLFTHASTGTLAIVGSGLRSLVTLAPAGTAFHPVLSVVQLGSSETLGLPTPAGAVTRPIGDATYENGTGANNTSGTTIVQYVTRNIFPQTVTGGMTADGVLAIMRPFVEASIDSAQLGSGGGGGGGSSSSGNSGVSSDGATLTNVTIQSGNATLSSVSADNLSAGTSTLGTTTVNGNLSVSGTLSAGTLTVGNLSSNAAVVAPYFTSTSTTATSTLPNVSSTNITSTNINGTNLTAINATTTNATSTNIFANAAHFVSGIIDSFTATLATITNLTSTNSTTTNATTTNLSTTNLSSTNFATNNLSIGGSTYNSLSGFGLTNSGGALSIATTAFSGSGSNFNADLLDGLDSTYFLANSFSSSSAAYYLAQNNVTGFSTTSADYWKTQRDFYSTTSANYWLTTKTTDNLVEGTTNLYYTNARARSALSSSATGLSYNNTTGVFSLTPGYIIPTTSSTSAWDSFYQNPSSRISAGTNLSWIGNTLNGPTDSYIRGLFSASTPIAYNSATGGFTFSTSSISGSGSNLNADLLDGLDSTYFLANSFSTSSADYFKSQRDFYSTTSANYWLTTKSTDNLAEGSTNLYFTNARARSALSATYPIQYNASTGVFSTAFSTTTPNTYSALQTFNGGLNVGASTFTSLLGTGLSNVGGTLTVSTSSFSGPGSNLNADYLNGQNGAYYLANSFSTTSADYYKTQRDFYSTTSANYWLTTKSTSNLAEGSNLYYTNARVDSRFATDLAGTTTDALAEGTTNLYYTNARARSALSSSATGLSYNNTTGVFSTTPGYVIPLTASTTDWNTAFLNRISSVTSPLSFSNNVLSISQAGAATSGYLSSADWNTFNNKISSTSLSATGPLSYNSSTGVFSLGTVGVANGGTGSTTLSGILLGNGTSAVQSLLVGSGLQLSGGTLSTTVSSSSLALDSQYFKQGGNSYGATATLGTVDNNPLQFITNNAVAGTFLTNGNFGVGTTSPSQRLSVGGNEYVSGNVSAASLNTSGNATVNSLNVGTLSGFLKATAGAVSTSLIDLSTDVTSTLPTTRGGTGITSYTTGDVLYADSTNHLTRLPVGSNGQVLKIQAGIPSWGVDQTVGAGGTDGIFATSTGLIYPIDTSNTLLIGTNATSTANSIFEVNGQAYISSKLAIGTTSPTATLSLGGGALISGTVSLGNLIDTALTANTLTYINSGNQLSSVALGSGLSFTGGNLSVATSSFSGNGSNFNADLLNGQYGSYYLANSFSTTSANYWLTGKTTDNLAEGSTNLYYTNARARSALSATYPIQYNSSTGVISTAFSTTTTNTFSGPNTFNGGVVANALTLGTLNGPLQANNGVISATTSIGVMYGGTGSTTLSGILLGNGTSAVQTLGIGANLVLSGGTLSVSTTSFSGPGSNLNADYLNGQNGAYYLANSYSTTSANYWLSGKSTTNLAEGTNLYYTNARVDSRFATDLAGTTTDALAEGVTNLYYTNARARAALSASSPLSYNSSTGAFSLGTVGVANGGTGSTTLSGILLGNGTSAVQTLGIGTGLQLSSGSLSVATSSFSGNGSNFNADFLNGQYGSYYLANSYSTTSANYWLSGKSTSNLAEGTNLYYTNARVDSRFATDLAGTTTDALAEGTTNLYYTNARVNTYVAGSSTIPKTYTSNTFTGAQTFNNGVTTNTLSIGSLTGVLHVSSGTVSASNVLLGSEVSGTLSVANGGTGSTTLTGILLGNGTASVQSLGIGSGLTLSAGTLSSSISTTSLALDSQYFKQGGNSYGTTATLGTNDSNALRFIINGSERGRFDTTGYFGIGTTSPAQPLSVSGNAYVSGTITAQGNPALQTTAATDGLILRGVRLNYPAEFAELRITKQATAWTDATSTAYFQVRNNDNNNLTFQAGTLGADAPFNRLQFPSSYTSYTDGVYGTTPAPTDLFELINTTAAKSIFKVRGASSQSGKYAEVNSYSGTGGDIFNIQSSGNVGIGTTSPFASLSVGGNIAITGGIYANGTRGTNGQILQTTGTGVQWTSTSTLGVALSDTTGTLSIARGGTNNTSYTTNGVVYYDGTEFNTATGFTYTGTSFAAPGSVTAGGQFVGKGGTGSASSPAYSFASDLTTGLYHYGSNELGFSTGGIGRAFIDPNGYFGIGSSSPSAALSVEGAALINGTVTQNQLIDLGLTTNALTYANSANQLSSVTIGTGLTFTGGTLAVSTTSFSGPGSNLNADYLNSQPGSYYLANSYSTTSANYWLSGKSTTNLAEGTNLYYTNARVDSRFATDLAGTTTDALAEGTTNLYFTNARARAAHSATYPILYNSSTGVFSTAFSTTTANTYSALNTFNSGVVANALTLGTLNGPLQANNGVVSATSSIGVLYGGTGLTIAPTYGQVLVGTSAGGYNLVATSTLGFQPAGSYENPLTFNYPLTRSTNTISLAFGTTTSNTWAGTQTFTNSPVFSTLGAGVVQSTSAGTIYNTATSSVSNGSGISFSGTAGALIGGSALTITNTGVLSVAQTYGTAQNGALTFATSSATTFNGLTISHTITNSGGTFTFGTPTIAGTLGVGGGGTGLATTPSYGQILVGNGSGYTLTATSSLGLGTVTSVNASGGSTGLSFSGGPITSSGTLTLAGTLGIANGGANNTSYTTNGVLYYDGSKFNTTTGFTFNGTDFASPGKVSAGGQIIGTGGTGSASAPSFAFASDVTTGIYHYGSNEIGFSTGGVPRAFIDPNGYFGIGSSSPSVALSVEGSSLINGTTTQNQLIDLGLTSNALTYANSSKQLSSVTLGTGLTFTSGTLAVSTTSFSGPGSGLNADYLNSQPGSYYLANSYSTTSANYWLTGKTTDNLAEGTTNLYFTNARARSALSATYPIQYNSSTGVISTAFSTTTTNTFSALNTFTGGVVANALTIGSLNGVLYGNSGAVAASATSTATLGSEFAYSGTLGSFVGGTSGNLTLATNGVVLTKLAQIPANTILGNPTGVTGNVQAFATSSLGLLTTNVAEGTNLYFTNARAQAAISVSGLPLTYSGGVIGINQANTSQAGYLSATDYNTFNNKISSTSLSATGPLSYNSSTGVFSLGTVGVANGGTGSTTLSGILLGNGTSAVQTLGIGTGLSLSSGVLSNTTSTSSLALDSQYFKQNGNSFGGLATLGTNDSNALRFITNGTERGRFDTSGNFGIGTTTPGSKLDVIGDITSDFTGTGQTRIVGIGVNGGFNSGDTGIFRFGDQYSQISNTFGGSLTQTAYNGSIITSNPAFGGFAGSAVLTVNSQSSNTAGVPILVAQGASGQTADIFQVQNNTPTTLFNVTAAGKVGIGTTSPSQLLSVGGGVYVTSTTTLANGNLIVNADGSVVPNSRGVSNSLFIGLSAGNGATGAHDSNFLGAYAGGGATNSLYSNFIGNSAGYSASSADSSNFFGLAAGSYATNASNSTFIGANAGSNATNAKNSIFLGGSAGYGDTVNNSGSAASTSIAIGQYAGTGGYSDSIALGHGVVNSAAGQLNIGNLLYGNGIYQSDTQSASPLAGKIGIGTSTPNYTLSVAGSFGLSGAFYDKNYSAGTNGQILQTTGSGVQWVATSSLGIGGSGSGTVNSGTTGQLPYYAANGTALTATSSVFLASTGYFGVSTTSPSQLLSVGGNAYVQGTTTLANGNFIINANGTAVATPFGLTGSFFVGTGAGTNATSSTYATFIGPNAGYGATNAYYSNFFGNNAGYGAVYSGNSNFFGDHAGYNAPSTQLSNFLGAYAGYNAANATLSNFLGASAGYNATYSGGANFLGFDAGYNATYSGNSNFLGNQAGYNAINAGNSNFLGYAAGGGATNAYNSTFLGFETGYNATNAANSIFIGAYAGLNDTVVNNASSTASTSIAIGQYAGTGGYSDSIAIGHGVKNSATGQLNIGNILYGTGIYMSDASSSVPLTGGRIGIGTSTPNYTLSVAGSFGLTGALYDKNYTAGTNGQILQTTGTGVQWVATSTLGFGSGTVNSGTTGQLPYYAANGTALTATSSVFLAASGNFGIGTTSPAQLLSVGGNEYVSGTTTLANGNFVVNADGSVSSNSRGVSGAFFVGSTAGSGATSAVFSNFIGNQAGYGAAYASQSNFIGLGAGYNATNAYSSNFLGYQAGYNATNALNSIFIGNYAGYNDTVNNSGNAYGSTSIAIGQYAGTGGYSDSIAIGSGVKNTASGQFDIGNLLYGNGINMLSATSAPVTNGFVGIGTTTPTLAAFTVESGSSTGNTMLTGNVNNYMQLNLQNRNGGSSASSDLVVTNDIGTASSYYADLGINSSGNTDSSYTLFARNDAYFYNNDASLNIGTASSSASAVLKFFTGGTLAANERARITSTGNFGIGTTTPNYTLSVAGSFGLTGALYDKNYTAGTNGMVLQTTGTGVQWVATSTLGLTGTGGTVTSVNASGGTTGLSFSGGPVTSSGTLTLAGTLGVANGGTGSTTLSGILLGNGTSAVQTLGIGTGLSLSSGVLSNTTSTSSLALDSQYFKQNGNSFGGLATLGTNDSNALRFITGGSEAARILTNGYVGIGTTSPATTFSVLGNTYTNGTTTLANGNFVVNADGSVVPNSRGVSNSFFVGSVAGSAATGATFGNFLGYGAGQNATNASNSNFLGYQAGAFATNASSSNFIGQLAGYNATNANLSSFLGVAAGSSATNAANSIFLGSYAGFSDTVNNTGTTASTSIAIGQYAGTGGYSDSIAIGHGVKNSAASQLNIGNAIYATGIYASDTQSSSPLAAAKVGIGTSSPNSVLSVGGNVTIGAATAGGTNGSLYVSGLATPAGSFLAVDGSGKVIATTTPSGGGGSGTVGSGTTGQLPYYAANGTSLTATSSIFLASNGNFGIGTTSPSSLLSIGTTNGINLSTGTSTFPSNVLFGASNPNYFTNAPVVVTTNTNNYGQLVLQNLNAGSEASGDFIVGADKMTNSTYYGDLGYNSSTFSDSAYTGLGANALYLYNSDGDLDLGTASTTGNFNILTGGTLSSNTRFTINANGNVGIGTTSPSTALSVVGTTTLANGNFVVSADGSVVANSRGVASSLFVGSGAGYGASYATNSNFFGTNAGYSAGYAANSNFFGYQAGQFAGSSNSNYFGYQAGQGATGSSNSNFFGYNAGYGAAGASSAFFLGNNAGYGTTNAANSFFFGNNAGYNDTVNNSGSSASTSIAIGQYAGTGGYSDSIALGHGVKNSATGQLNIANVLYGTGIYMSDTQSSSPTANGRIGIGTSSPYAQLSLGGGNLVLGASSAGGTNGNLYLNGLATSAGSFLAVDGSGKVIATTTPSGGGGSLTGTTGQVAYFSGTNTAIGTSTITISTAGNVGIGTTSPYTAFAVVGTTTLANGNFTVNADGSAVSNAYGITGLVAIGPSAGLGSYAGAGGSAFIGDHAGVNAWYSGNSNFFGSYAGNNVTNGGNSNFFGYFAGYQANNAGNSNFFGRNAGTSAANAQYSNFFGPFAGNNAGSAQFSNFFGYQAGQNATNAASSTFIGTYAGQNATNAANAIFLGSFAGSNDTVNNTGSTASTSIAIGQYAGTGGYSDSIAIGHGVTNSAAGQLNIGDVLYGTGIYMSDATSSTALATGKVGIGTSTPSGTLGVNGTSYLAGAVTVQSSSASALTVGLNGGTNPALTVDASTASSATGLKIKSAAAAAGLALSVTSSGTNENLTLDAKGSGTISIGSVSTGNITLTRATTLSNGATVTTGGLTVSAGTSALSGGVTVTGNYSQTGGYFQSTGVANGTASTVRFGYTGATDSTAMTASTEAPDTYFNLGQVRTHSTGALTLQRDFRITGSTHAFSAASSLATAASLAIDAPPVGGTNATIGTSTALLLGGVGTASANTTNAYALVASAPTGASNNYSAIFLGGGVGIGTSSPTAQFQTTGTVRLSNFGAGTLQTDALGNLSVSSDERLKNIDGSFSRGLADIEKLSPILYHWNAISGLDQATQYAGFSAQNVQANIPEAVFTDSRGYLTLQDRPILAASVNAIKELAGQTDALGISTTTLGTQVAALSAQFASSTAATQAWNAMPHALTATTINADTMAIAQGVSAGTLTTQSVNANGTVSASRYVVPATAQSFTLGSTTVTATLPTEALTDGGNVDMYKLASYAVASVQNLSSRTDLLSVKIDDIESRLAALEALNGSNATTSGTVSGAIGLAGTSVKDALAALGIFVENGLARLDTLVTHQLVLQKGTDGTSSAGSVTIPAGATTIAVSNQLVATSSKVFITFTSSVDGSWYLSQKQQGSFTVVLSKPQTTDTSFDYFIVETEVQVAGAAASNVPAAQPTQPTTTGTTTDNGGNTASSTPPVPTNGSPSISLNGDAGMSVVQGGTWSDPGATATDATDGDLSAKIAVSGGVDTTTAGTYTITYRATNSAGKYAEVSRIVTVLAPTSAPSSSGVASGNGSSGSGSSGSTNSSGSSSGGDSAQAPDPTPAS